MTFRQVLLGGLGVAGAALATWIVASLLLVQRVSQREESWHEVAVRNLEPQSEQAYVALRSRQHWLEWDDFTPGGKRFLIRLYEDRSFLYAAFAAGTPSRGMPDRYFSGPVPAATWASIRAALDDPLLRESMLPPKPDVKITAGGSQGRAVHGYRKEAYGELPRALRALDEAILATVAGALIQPDRAYARRPPAIRYTAAELPALLAALERSDPALQVSVARRMIAIGPEGSRALIRFLEAGRNTGFLPAGPYLAVLDAMLPLPSDPALIAALEPLTVEAGNLPPQLEIAQKARAILKYARSR